MEVKKVRVVKKCIQKIVGLFGYRLLRKDWYRLVTQVDLEITPPPPSTIPESLISDFTMGDKIPLFYFYRNDTVPNEKKLHITAERYKESLKKIEKRTFKYFGDEVNAFYDALEKYPLSGKSVLIWGLADCNCEAIALGYNASKVYVVDYNKPICDHPLIEVLTHGELIAKNIRVDFAFSYSSFEHDGLGRYGDPIDPNGDIKAMQDAHDKLNNNGILFLGVGLGKDALCWNIHKIYGKYRLPLLLKGWQCLDVFDSYKYIDKQLPFDVEQDGYYRRSVLVLKKIPGDFPDDSVLKEAINNSFQNVKGTNNPRMLDMISQFILDYKNGADKRRFP
ncbi:hypothetical protein FACS1894137_02900 [Spirochaetia bacterium]|nr:hypothetical protein FACS1894137_02900 [Spirochaetia bacterium]